MAGIVFESYLTCPMRYYWAKVAGVEREPSDPLVRGTLGHVLTAHHYARKVSAERGLDPDKFYTPEDAARLVAEKWGAVGEKMLPVALRAFDLYRRTYVVETFEVIGIEQLIETEFHGYRYTARVDMAVRVPATGKVWFYDHKYVGRIEDKTFQRYTLSGQFLGLHHLGARKFGAEFGGVIVNAVGCFDGRCERRAPAPSPWALERFPGTVRAAELGIAAMEASRQPPDHMAVSELACFHPYGRCDFYDHCRWGTAV